MERKHVVPMIITALIVWISFWLILLAPNNKRDENRGLIPHSCDVSYEKGNIAYDRAELAYELGIEKEYAKQSYFAIKHYLRAIYMCEKKNPPRSLMLKEKVIELREKPTL